MIKYLNNLRSWDDKNEKNYKKFKRHHSLFNIAFYILNYIAPMITILTMTYRNGEVASKGRWSIIIIVIVASIILGLLNYWKDDIKKKNIYKLNGDCNRSVRVEKHLELAANGIIPLVLVIYITILFRTWLIESSAFYMTMIITICSFMLVGRLWKALILSVFDEEEERIRIKSLNNATR